MGKFARRFHFRPSPRMIEAVPNATSSLALIGDAAAAAATPATWSKRAKPHQPTKGLSCSRAQVSSSTPPSTAVTATFTADNACMSSCMGCPPHGGVFRASP
jgi:hypothetical protein